ncbi:MAG TPA: protoporphyrinogen oxidase [Pyrinomonadaceae bacterium]|nr:protoporphyrinogen oxidase [Pyrinomonadaceae bacterium]
MKRIAIIGGGISGLAAMHRLIELSTTNRQPIHITLLEASSRLGGTIQTEHRDGFLLERGPDSFIAEKPEAVALSRRLGIESHLIQTNEQHRRSFIVRNGRLRAVPQGFQLLAPSRLWPFINSDIFSVTGKLRMSMDLFLPRRAVDGDESLASFVRRRLGREALERMAQPMVGGIYTADPEVLSLRATLPRFLEIEREHRSLLLGMWRRGRTSKSETGVSGARYSLFLSFDEGMELLVDALERKIADFRLQIEDLVHSEIRLKTRVESLDQDRAQNWQIRTASGGTLEVDAVCLAVPAYAAASLLTRTAPQISSQLSQIKFASTATINLGYSRSDIGHKLDGFGFVVPFIEKRSLIACTFSSVKFSGRAPKDLVLLRAFVGGALQPKMLTLDEAEIVKRVAADLKDLLRITGKPLFSEVALWHNSMPQYEVGHLDRIEQVESEVTKVAGLTLAGNSYRGAGIPDCIRSGEMAAELMMGTLRDLRLQTSDLI